MLQVPASKLTITLYLLCLRAFLPWMTKQLGNLVEEMTTLLDKRGTSSTSAMNHSLTRHREILQDYERDFKRTRAQIVENEQRQNLLGSVRDEISAFKSGQSATSSGGAGASDSDMLLSERSRIDNSHRMTDEVLEQAYATRYEFAQQRSAIGNVNTRMKGVMSKSLHCNLTQHTVLPMFSAAEISPGYLYLF